MKESILEALVGVISPTEKGIRTYIFSGGQGRDFLDLITNPSGYLMQILDGWVLPLQNLRREESIVFLQKYNVWIALLAWGKLIFHHTCIIAL